MSKLIILCTSYGEIPSTLCLAKQNYPDNSVTIASANKPNLFKFFQLVNEKVFHNNLNVIYLAYYDSENAERKGIIAKAFDYVSDIIKERRYLNEMYNRYFAELEGCEVFFQVRPIGGNLFYLLRRLSKRNKLVYIPFYDSPQARQVRTYFPTNIADLIYFIIRKLAYGFDLAMAEQPYKKGFSYISDRFIEKKVDRIIDWEEKNEMMKGFDLSQFKVFSVGNYSVIFFDAPLLVEAGRVADGDAVPERSVPQAVDRGSEALVPGRSAPPRDVPGRRPDLPESGPLDRVRSGLLHRHDARAPRPLPPGP